MASFAPGAEMLASPLASDRLPTLLGSRPIAAAEDVDPVVKKGGRRCPPAPLEITVDIDLLEGVEEFCVKNTFIQGSALRDPSLERFYQERHVHTCPGQNVGRLVDFSRDAASRWADGPLATPRLRRSTPGPEDQEVPTSCTSADFGFERLLSPAAGMGFQHTPTMDASFRPSLFHGYGQHFGQAAREPPPYRSGTIQSTPPPPMAPAAPALMPAAASSTLASKSTLSAFAPVFEMPSASQRLLPPVMHQHQHQHQHHPPSCLGTEAYMPASARQPHFEPPAGARRPVLSLSAALGDGSAAAAAAAAATQPFSAIPSHRPLTSSIPQPFAAEYQPQPMHPPVAQSLAARGARTVAALLSQHPPASPRAAAAPAPATPPPTAEAKVQAPTGRAAATAPAAPVPPAPAKPPAPPPTAAAPDLMLPSLGSAAHGSSRCRPCAFLHTKGCENGQVCQFCHLCGPDERKRRRKEKVAAARVRRGPA